MINAGPGMYRYSTMATNTVLLITEMTFIMFMSPIYVIFMLLINPQ